MPNGQSHTSFARAARRMVAAPTLLSMLLCGSAWLTIGSNIAAAEKPAPAKPPAAQPAKNAGVCTQVTGSVISEAYGYKHVVSLRNGCDKPVECQLWTDVDPTPRQVVRADKGETVEIVTRIGSPASEFKALKECRFP